MSQQRHVIKQQIIDLQVTSKTQVFELQNQLSAVYRHRIVPIIETICNQLSTAEQVHRIDSLTIELGEINLQTLEADFTERVTQQLYQQLAETLDLSTTTPISTNHSHQDKAPLTSKFSQSNAAIPSPKSSASGHPPTASQLELLSHFIQTGRLPWWCEPLSKTALADCFDQLLLTSPEAIKAMLTNQLKQPQSLQRLIHQFPDKILSKIAILIAPDCSTWVESYLQDIQKLVPQIDSWRSAPPQHLRLTLWQGLFLQRSPNPTSSLSSEAVIQQSLHHLASNFPANESSLFQKLHQAVERLRIKGTRFESDLPKILKDYSTKEKQTTVKGTTSKNLLQPRTDLFPKALNELAHFSNKQRLPSHLQANINKLVTQLTKLTQEDINGNLFSINENTLFIELKALIEALEKDDLSSANSQVTQLLQSVDQSQPSTHPFNHSEEIYIQNAGLVLFWPFLNRFFTALNLVQSDQFIQLESAKRAVLLLQYLAAVTTGPPEHLLPLNKLLCGLDLLEPIEGQLSLSTKEETECNNLSMAVIQNWSALKSTTPSGLRESFLQRPGMLKMKSGRWQLQIEPESYDILINQLPWNIEIVKLPWMKELISTNW